MKRYIKSAIVNIGDEDLGVQLEFLKHNADVEDLEPIIKSNPAMALEVASNPNLSESLIRQIWETYKFRASNSLAKNPNTPADILDQIVDSESRDMVLISVAKNPNTAAETLQRLLINKNTNLKLAIIKNPNTTVDMLRRLTRYPNALIKRAAIDTLWQRGEHI